MDGQFRRVRNYRVYLTEVLGKGSFGTVLKGYDEKEGRWLAVKTVKLDQLTKDGECIYGNEIETLCSLKGSNIVKLLDAIEDDFYFYLFFEYCEGGDLEALLEKKKFLSEKEACSIVKQIAKAFLDQDQRQENDRKFISMMHRDIKPANILFSQGKVKVADFGMAKFIDYFDKDRKKRYDLCGTPYYLAPQVLNREHYSAKCDIWSTGILFYEILFGRLPWNATTERGLYEAAKYQGLSFPKQVSREVQDLISMMLKFREEERLSWGEVFIHRALKESRFEPKIEKENFPSSNSVNPLIKDLPSQYKPGYDVQKYPYVATGMRYYDRNLAVLLDNKAHIPYTTRYNIKPDLEKPDYNDYKPRPYDLGRNH